MQDNRPYIDKTFTHDHEGKEMKVIAHIFHDGSFQILDGKGRCSYCIQWHSGNVEKWVIISKLVAQAIDFVNANLWAKK